MGEVKPPTSTEGDSMALTRQSEKARDSHGTNYDKGLSFNYKYQAWVRYGIFVRCGHKEAMNCQCYGRIHEGERVEHD